MTKRRFLVIGLGLFGSEVARTLSDAGVEVIVLDRDKETVQRAKEHTSQAMVADATNRDVLNGLDLKPDDVVIVAMGETLEASILATLFLKEIGLKNIIVKANDEYHAKILSTLGATEVVFPEREAALRLARRISSRNIIDFIPIVEGYSIEEIAPSRKVIGRKIRELDLRKKYGVQVIAIKDVIEDRVELVIDPDRVVKDSDVMIVLGMNSDLKRLRSL